MDAPTKNALLRYRVMANVVGVLLIVLILIGMPLKYLTPDGIRRPARSASGSRTYLGVAHGWLYMIFLVVAFLLARREKWDPAFTHHHAAVRHRPDPVVLGRAPGHRPGPRRRTGSPARLVTEPPMTDPRPHRVRPRRRRAAGRGRGGHAPRARSRPASHPDVILGTSVGALNGALVAADPGEGVVDRLLGLWESAAAARRCTATARSARSRRAVRTGTHLHSAGALRERLHQELGDRTFDELAVAFQCCAASIERAAEHWFTEGRVVDAVVACAAVPGLLRPASRRRRALPRRRHRELDPGRPRRRVRRGPDLRAPGRPGRPAAGAAAQARGRWPGSPSRSPGGTASTARWRRCPTTCPRTCCRPAAAVPATTSCCPTATSRR